MSLHSLLQRGGPAYSIDGGFPPPGNLAWNFIDPTPSPEPHDKYWDMVSYRKDKRIK